MASKSYTSKLVVASKKKKSGVCVWWGEATAVFFLVEIRGHGNKDYSVSPNRSPSKPVEMDLASMVKRQGLSMLKPAKM